MRRRTITGEERELWRRAVRDVSPLRGGSADSPAPPREPVRAGAIIANAQRLPMRLQAPGANPRHYVFGGGDPRLDRAAARRRIAIEREIDLHGMTQVEAHRALLGFIAQAVVDGARLVLVVTGKGKAQTPDMRGGVLRSRFLDWVEIPPLKSEIARVAPASQKDGGAGAFYVFLKRKGAGPSPRL